MTNLHGRTLLITRPQPEADITARQVQLAHGIPLVEPSLTILPPKDPTPLRQALHHLENYHGIILTSINGARALVSELNPILKPKQLPPPLFSVGKKTAQLLKKQGWSVQIPEHASGGEALAEAIMDWQKTEGQKTEGRFLFPRAEKGREELRERLQQSGCHVDVVTAYRTKPIRQLSTSIQTALKTGKVDAVLFFSSYSAESFISALPEQGKSWLKNVTIATISTTTAKAVMALGESVDVVASQPNSECLLSELESYWKD